MAIMFVWRLYRNLSLWCLRVFTIDEIRRLLMLKLTSFGRPPALCLELWGAVCGGDILYVYLVASLRQANQAPFGNRFEFVA